MNKSVLGIDLGTSSVKILQRFQDGTVVKAKSGYEEITPKGWWKALCETFAQIDLSTVAAIGLSSQVGTYIVDDGEVISWNSGEGAEELAEIKGRYDKAVFVREILMPHPDILSYPLPRLMYIKSRYPKMGKICQPKDHIAEKLTGNYVTDPYSWRGLANSDTCRYSEFFLKELNINREILPKIVDYTKLAGYTREIPLNRGTILAGIPVFVGLNDYYASLLGMGMGKSGELFDITGTSEHLGVIEDSLCQDTQLISSPYLQSYVHYGVTASSGASLNLALEMNGNRLPDRAEIRKRKPPVFLPYLNGERAPVWDGAARGCFFGLSAGCNREDMAYAILEGVVFSLYHIYEKLGKPEADKMISSGGAAVNPVLNSLKAEIFGVPVAVTEEIDTSAQGAAMIAAMGAGWYETKEEAIGEICRIREVVQPTGEYRDWLEKRFAVYKDLYPALKPSYNKWKEIGA